MISQMYLKVIKIQNIFFIGIGYIKKQAKNQVAWLKPEIFQNDKGAGDKKQNKELLKLQKEDQLVKNLLKVVQQEVSEFKKTQDYEMNSFLTYNDIEQITSKLKDKTIISIMTPDDVKVDYLHDDQRKKMLSETKDKMNTDNSEYIKEVCETLSNDRQVYFSSEKGKIGVYLIMNKEEKPQEKELNNNPYDPFVSPSIDYSPLNRTYNRVLLSSDSKKDSSKSNFYDLAEGLLI